VLPGHLDACCRIVGYTGKICYDTARSESAPRKLLESAASPRSAGTARNPPMQASGWLTRRI